MANTTNFHFPSSKLFNSYSLFYQDPWDCKSKVMVHNIKAFCHLLQKWTNYIILVFMLTIFNTGSQTGFSINLSQQSLTNAIDGKVNLSEQYTVVLWSNSSCIRSEGREIKSRCCQNLFQFKSTKILSPHSSMASTAACYWGGPGFKSRQGQEFINF